jgi:hypothetical protein
MKLNHQSSLLSLMSLSLATSPFIFSLLILHFWGEWLQNMGKLSEEVFRAKQLPLLYVSQNVSQNVSQKIVS